MPNSPIVHSTKLALLHTRPLQHVHPTPSSTEHVDADRTDERSEKEKIRVSRSKKEREGTADRE